MSCTSSGSCGLIDFVVRVVERGREADENAGQLLNFRVCGRALERVGGRGDLLLQRNAACGRVSGDGQDSCPLFSERQRRADTALPTRVTVRPPGVLNVVPMLWNKPFAS